MALKPTVPFGPDNSGISGTNIRPITEGVPVAVTNDQTSGGVFGWLDDVGSSLSDTFSGLVNNAADIRAGQYLDKLVGGPGESADSTGDVADNPQNVAHPPVSFVDRYKTPLMIGGGVLALLAVVALVRK